MERGYRLANVDKEELLRLTRQVARGERMAGFGALSAGAAMMLSSAFTSGIMAEDALFFGVFSIAAGWGLLVHAMKRRTDFLKRMLTR